MLLKPAGTSLYSGSSLQTVEVAGSEYQAAGVMTKGPLRILARVAGPQQFGGTEMYGQPLTQPSHLTAALNILTTWPS